jgi:hypothetical protein
MCLALRCVGLPGVLLLALTLPARAEDLSTELMKATFKLINEKSTATGFVLSRPSEQDPDKTQFVLVTAAHVLETMTGDEGTIVYRQREAAGVYRRLPVKIPIRNAGKPLWVKHPAADIAALALLPPPQCAIPRLPLELLATDETLLKYAVHPGDLVRCLGYPHRMEANEAGFSILRSGPLASYPLVPTKQYRTFLVSTNTFEGDSGGPVYLDEPQRLLTGQRQPEPVRLIVGLVIGQHFLDEEARLVYGTTKTRHRLGLAIVVPAAFVRETIERVPQAP